MINTQNIGYQVSDFYVLSGDCVYFRTNAFGLGSITAVFLQQMIWHLITQEGLYFIKYRKLKVGI